MSGWPHLETLEDYKLFVVAFSDGSDGMTFFSSGRNPICEDCNPDMDPDFDYDAEKFFSSLPCDVCNRGLAGDRLPAHAIDQQGELLHLDICLDCGYFSEYGRLDDESMISLDPGNSLGR